MQQSRTLSRSTLQTSWKAMAEMEKVWVRALEMKSSRLTKSVDLELPVDGEEQHSDEVASLSIEAGADHWRAT
jgi:hypothetical protein